MTINVALVTNELVILGCDSVASATSWYLNPTAFVEVDADGKYVTDEEGRFLAKFSYTDLQEVVSDAWGGVTKMFALRSEKCSVAAVTAGLAQLNNHTISALASEFHERTKAEKLNTVHDVAKRFVESMSEEYERHHAASKAPPALRADIEFLIGGFGSEEQFPALFRVRLNRPEAERITAVYGRGEGFPNATGVAWSGQSDGVQRLLFGYDNPVKVNIESQVRQLVDNCHRDMSEATLRILTNTLAALKAELPQEVDTELPGKPEIGLSWDYFRLDIDYANLPTQSAVEFVSYLVNLQSGKSKFVRGVPTVGGRTHIGIIQRGKFEMLNEPELQHRNTGYDREL